MSFRPHANHGPAQTDALQWMPLTYDGVGAGVSLSALQITKLCACCSSRIAFAFCFRDVGGGSWKRAVHVGGYRRIFIVWILLFANDFYLHSLYSKY